MKQLLSLLILLLSVFTMKAAKITGQITDRKSGEPLIGATVTVAGKNSGTAADFDGRFSLSLSEGTYNLIIKYVGYKDLEQQVHISGNEMTFDFALESDTQILGEVQVTAERRRDNEAAMIRNQQESLVVQTSVSAQQISRTQDKDASEVIRRVPGISILDEKFVMVRGLSQRYNNVWLNGGAVPSSEPDSRAFSFDIIPSSQLNDIVIVKSPTPEYPADFTGGFVIVNTRQMPIKNGLNLSVGYGINDKTHFKNFYSSRGHTDNLPNNLIAYPGYENNSIPRLDVLGNGFYNDWTIRKKSPWGDIKLSADYSGVWTSDNGNRFGLLAAVNYSNSYKTLLNMENSLYGPYDVINDRPVYLRSATDNQWSNDMRLGAMLNLSFRPAGDKHSFEWKNIFNLITKDRYSERIGFNAQPDNINDMEYYYTSRATYNTQLSGRHDYGNKKIDWCAGYAYAERNMPDRRLIERTDRTDNTMGIYRISREFAELNEHIASVTANYKQEFHTKAIDPTLKAGIYGEYRKRDYNTRQFDYGWQPENSLPNGFMFDPNVQDNILIDSNYGPDKLYLYEMVNYMNNYRASQFQISAYAGVNIPWNQWNLYAGARFESVRQSLWLNSRQYEPSEHRTNYDYNDIFPSINATYKITDKHQLRLAYGESVNRPEFRELSTSVFYDFDLGSSVMGNYDLKACYIHNLDLRYEWYPADGEQISVALFYKHFNNPIEWTYTVAGGTDLIYSFINAQGANNYGIELDIRKNLDFIGLENFSLSFNGSLIKSKVKFDEGTNNIDRPMQGQSPYIINTGLFYNHPRAKFNASILYNRIGKRIIGVGNRYGTAADGSARNIPNSYEMPRNALDISLSKKFGDWEVKLAARDVIAEKVIFKQIEDVAINGETKTIEETTRSYKPGRNFSLSINYTF